MDSTSLSSLQQLLEIINAGGVTVVLLMLIVLFFRGDIIPRKVYERMLRDLLTKIAADIIASVTSLLREQSVHSEKQIEELKARFNHIEECIEQARKTKL